MKLRHATAFVLKRLMLVVFVVLAGIGLITVAHYLVVHYFAAISVKEPQFEISETPDGADSSANFTYTGEAQITVSRFLINGRAGEPGCDSSAPVPTPAPDAALTPESPLKNPKVPFVLRTGDGFSIYNRGCAGALLSVVIFTDHGNLTF